MPNMVRVRDGLRAIDQLLLSLAIPGLQPYAQDKCGFFLPLATFPTELFNRMSELRMDMLGLLHPCANRICFSISDSALG